MYLPQLSNKVGEITSLVVLEGTSSGSFTLRSKGAAVGNNLVLSSGAGSAGAGGNISLTTGAGTTTSGTLTLASSDVAGASAGNLVLAPGRGSAVANDGAVVLQSNAASRPVELRFQDNAGGQYIALKAPATISSSFSLALPTADGTSGQALVTDGAGQLSFATPSGSGKLLQTLFTEISVDTTTTSTVFTGLLSQAITIASGSDVLVFFSAGASNTNNNQQVRFRLTIDGSPIRATAFVSSAGATNTGSASLVYRATGLSAGAHTVAMQWSVTANTGRIRPVAAASSEHASLIVQEVIP